MTMDELVAGLPEYARDLRRNYEVLVKGGSVLTPQQIWGLVLSVGMSVRCAAVTAAAMREAEGAMTKEALECAKAVAALVGMSNVYYKFTHMTKNGAYGRRRTGLRMEGLLRPRVAALDFELWCLAVSVVNGCAVCVEAHERALMELGAGTEWVLAGVRVAAVVEGIAAVVAAEGLGCWLDGVEGPKRHEVG